MRVCPSCGEENPDKAKFCHECATSLADELPGPGEVRKTVTVVFCDLIGSTSIGERLDPEALRRVQTDYFDAMSRAIERHGGSVEKYIGDAVMAVFGIPTVHEDDALRAVRAAADMQNGLAELNEELERDRGIDLQVRIGVNTGEVVSGDYPSIGQAMVTGDAVNVAARLEQAATPGEILIGEPTYRLVRGSVSAEPVEPLSVKGKTDLLQAFKLISVLTESDQPAARMGSPMVGREPERMLLRWAFDRAVKDRSCQLTTILGAAGVGKSRLVFEFLKDVGAACTTLRGRCLPYGEGITFRPVAEIVRQAVGVSDSVASEDTRSRVKVSLGSDPNADVVADRLDEIFGSTGVLASPEETFWAVRKLLEALARERPVVVVFDDIHWGETTLLDLIEHVADWSRDAPILLVCMARPELLDRRTGWAGGKLNASTTLLDPLSASDCQVLIENLLGRTELTEDVRSRIADAAEGNPLFVEEMIAMLIDDGRLRKEGGAWIPVGLADVAVPPTIQALLAARLDLLLPEECAVLQRGSVEGKVFHRSSVMELTPPEGRSGLASHLMALVRKELIRPDQPEFAGDDAFRFRHLLIRDAAYESIAKLTRAEMHERLAVWMQQVTSDRPTEYEEIIGYHLEQAHRFRSDLGPLDERGVELGRRASETLGAAGRRALGRGDVRAAINLLDRTVALLPDDDPMRSRSLPDLGAALDLGGDLSRAESVFAEAMAVGRDQGDSHVELRAIIGRSNLRMRTNPEGKTAEAQQAVETAIPLFEAVGDDLGLSEAWRLSALIEHMLGRAGAMSDALERAIHHARRAGAVGQLGEMFAALLSDPNLRGPMPVIEDIERTETVIDDVGQNRRLQLAAHLHLGVLRGMQGNFDEARTLLLRAESIGLDLGLAPTPYILMGRAGYHVEMLANDPSVAERFIRREYDTLDRMNERTIRSTDAGYLAQALFLLGRVDEAERFTRICREVAATDDRASQILWRSAQAKVLASKGESNQATSLGREAVALSRSTDYVVMQADALMDLAEVETITGRLAGAIPLIDEAIELYEAKGIVPATDRALLMRSRSTV